MVISCLRIGACIFMFYPRSTKKSLAERAADDKDGDDVAHGVSYTS